jgi:tRNA threonylcarbamoyladenosine biosynthesis protein TsaE
MTDTDGEVLIKQCHDESAMLLLAKQLADVLQFGTILYLKGPLGAGKTTLTRGILAGLGFRGKVKSPTYALVEPYDIAGRKFFHFDLYRIKDPKELYFIGMSDYFIPEAICVVEWPENGSPLLPNPDLICSIHIVNEGREINLTAFTDRGKKLLAKLI